MDHDLKYQIALGLIPGVGCVNAKKLVAYLGSVEAVFSEKKQVLQKIPGIGEILSEKISKADVLKRAEQEIEFITKFNIRCLFYLNPEYPFRLTACDDSPLMLFVKGNVDFNQSKIISIVGTRNASHYGKEFCNQFISDLTSRGHKLIVISGLAYGIDIASHQAALRYHQPTVGVLGHGLDMIYPGAHKNIARRMVEQGALVTEFLTQTIPDKPNFVKRNRIVAGMADATLVVESGIRGGALITAQMASSYSRDVFALPGRHDDKMSAGCNWLIKKNLAALLENAIDLEDYLGWDNTIKTNQPIQKNLFQELPAEEQNIIGILKNGEMMQIDEICLVSKIPMSKVSSALFNLEFAGLVLSLPGKIYKLR